MLIVREAIGFSGRPFKALGQKRGQTHRSHGDLSLKDEDVRDNETYIKDNDSKFGGN
jgi:hypothetical protein